MILVIWCFIWRLTQEHENKINVQDVREADGGTNGFWQRNAEEFGLVEDRNGLYNSNSCMRERDEIYFFSSLYVLNYS